MRTVVKFRIGTSLSFCPLTRLIVQSPTRAVNFLRLRGKFLKFLSFQGTSPIFCAFECSNPLE